MTILGWPLKRPPPISPYLSDIFDLDFGKSVSQCFKHLLQMSQEWDKQTNEKQ